MLVPATAAATATEIRSRTGWRSVAAVVWRCISTWVGRPWRMRMTQTYACILVVTTLLLSGTNQRVDNAVLRSASTNLHQLSSRPFHVLLSSAFWTERGGMIGFAVMTLVVFSPLEVWAGKLRWAIVFLAGHVGATLLVAAGLAIALHYHQVSPTVTRSIDVGYSYAAWCAAAFLVYRLSRPWRIAAIVGLAAVLLATIALSGHYSAWGHLAAAAIGLALYPLRPRVANASAT